MGPRAIGLGVLLALAAPLTSHAAAGVPGTGCPIGSAAAPKAADRVPVTPPVVVGCGRLRRQGTFQLVGYRIGGDAGRTHVCLETHFATGGDVQAFCPEPVRPLHLWFTAAEVYSLFTFAGTVSRHVARLTLRYWSYGRLKRGSIVLLRVTDQRVLAALGLKKQFSYFEGEAPAQLNRFDLLARSASGRLLDRRYIDFRQISAARS